MVIRPTIAPPPDNVGWMGRGWLYYTVNTDNVLGGYIAPRRSDDDDDESPLVVALFSLLVTASLTTW